MDFKRERINIHNNYPEKIEFKAERQFRERLEKLNGAIPFKTIQLSTNDSTYDDSTYQIYVGHFIDGLDALPERPDYMFDHCFRVLDHAGSTYFKNKGNKGVVQGLGALLLKESTREWIEIINELGNSIPLMTCRYVSSILETSYYGDTDTSKQIRARVEECIGKSFYDEYIKHFESNKEENLNKNFSKNIDKSASFLKLYLSGKKGTKKHPNVHSKLDLTKEQNVPTPNTRIEFILSILLFTMRNERFHGTKLSQFRTSKATLEKYESFYYAMTASYIFALGSLQLHGYGNLNDNKILECCKENLKLQKQFFSTKQTNKFAKAQ